MILTNTDSLADSNEDTEVTVAIYKYSANGNHKKLTSAKIQYGHFVHANGSSYTSQNALGELVFDNIEIKKKASFLDYIFGGCEVSLHNYIDFTLSNGRPETPQSLHYWGPQNQYEMTLRAVGGIL